MLPVGRHTLRNTDLVQTLLLHRFGSLQKTRHLLNITLCLCSLLAFPCHVDIFVTPAQMMKLKPKSLTNSPGIYPSLPDLQFYGLFSTLSCASLLKHALQKREKKQSWISEAFKAQHFVLLCLYECR